MTTTSLRQVTEMAHNFESLHVGTRFNASINKFQINLQHIIEKYDKPFENSDAIDLSTLRIVSNKGELERKSFRPVKFGKAKLAIQAKKGLSCLVPTNATLEATQIDKSERGVQSNISALEAITDDFLSSILEEELEQQLEPSDAETLSSDSEEEETSLQETGCDSTTDPSDSTDERDCDGQNAAKGINLESGRDHVPEKCRTLHVKPCLHRKPHLPQRSSAGGWTDRVIACQASSKAAASGYDGSESPYPASSSGSSLENGVYFHALSKSPAVKAREPFTDGLKDLPSLIPSAENLQPSRTEMRVLNATFTVQDSQPRHSWRKKPTQSQSVAETCSKLDRQTGMSSATKQTPVDAPAGSRQPRPCTGLWKLYPPVIKSEDVCYNREHIKLEPVDAATMHGESVEPTTPSGSDRTVKINKCSGGISLAGSKESLRIKSCSDLCCNYVAKKKDHGDSGMLKFPEIALYHTPSKDACSGQKSSPQHWKLQETVATMHFSAESPAKRRTLSLLQHSQDAVVDFALSPKPLQPPIVGDIMMTPSALRTPNNKMPFRVRTPSSQILRTIERMKNSSARRADALMASAPPKLFRSGDPMHHLPVTNGSPSGIRAEPGQGLVSRPCRRLALNSVQPSRLVWHSPRAGVGKSGMVSGGSGCESTESESFFVPADSSMSACLADDEDGSLGSDNSCCLSSAEEDEEDEHTVIRDGTSEMSSTDECASGEHVSLGGSSPHRGSGLLCTEVSLSGYNEEQGDSRVENFLLDTKKSERDADIVKLSNPEHYAVQSCRAKICSAQERPHNIPKPAVHFAIPRSHKASPSGKASTPKKGKSQSLDISMISCIKSPDSDGGQNERHLPSLWQHPVGMNMQKPSSEMIQTNSTSWMPLQQRTKGPSVKDVYRGEFIRKVQHGVVQNERVKIPPAIGNTTGNMPDKRGLDAKDSAFNQAKNAAVEQRPSSRRMKGPQSDRVEFYVNSSPSDEEQNVAAARIRKKALLLKSRPPKKNTVMTKCDDLYELSSTDDECTREFGRLTPTEGTEATRLACNSYSGLPLGSPSKTSVDAMKQDTADSSLDPNPSSKRKRVASPVAPGVLHSAKRLKGRATSDTFLVARQQPAMCSIRKNSSPGLSREQSKAHSIPGSHSSQRIQGIPGLSQDQPPRHSSLTTHNSERIHNSPELSREQPSSHRTGSSQGIQGSPGLNREQPSSHRTRSSQGIQGSPGLSREQPSSHRTRSSQGIQGSPGLNMGQRQRYSTHNHETLPDSLRSAVRPRTEALLRSPKLSQQQSTRYSTCNRETNQDSPRLTRHQRSEANLASPKLTQQGATKHSMHNRECNQDSPRLQSEKTRPSFCRSEGDVKKQAPRHLIHSSEDKVGSPKLSSRQQPTRQSTHSRQANQNHLSLTKHECDSSARPSIHNVGTHPESIANCSTSICLGRGLCDKTFCFDCLDD